MAEILQEATKRAEVAVDSAMEEVAKTTAAHEQNHLKLRCYQSEEVKELQQQIHEIDRRLVRLESMIEFTQLQKSIEDKNKKIKTNS